MSTALTVVAGRDVLRSKCFPGGFEVAEATKAAATAAQAAQASQIAQAAQIAQMQSQAAAGSPSPSSSPTGATHSVDWSKLINKPPVLDGKTLEDEIRAYRDWNWQLIQYLNAIDTSYESELQQIMDDPTKPLEMTTASTETRQRSAKLYGLLASLCRNRSLNVVRSVKQADGFEALRQLTLTLRPSTNNRGLALGCTYKLESIQHAAEPSTTTSQVGGSP